MTLIEPEVDGDGDHNRNWSSAIFEGRLELVFPDRLQRLLVEPHAQRANHARIDGIALRIDDEGDHDLALVLGATGFVRELCFRGKQRNRSGNLAADAE